MNLRSSRSAVLALGVTAALAVALVPAVSGAQTAPRELPANPQPNRAPPAPPQFERGDPRGFDRRPEALERRLEFLRSELRINAAQQRVWDEFADAVRREAEGDPGQAVDPRDEFRGNNGRGGPPSIVERLERRQQATAERSAYFERMLDALRPLYAALNEDQRRAADEHLFSPGRDGRRGPRRFGMDRGFGGDFYGRFNRPFGPLERSFGPLDQPYGRFDRSYR